MFILSTPTHINGMVIRVLALSVVDRGFELRSDQTKDYNN